MSTHFVMCWHRECAKSFVKASRVIRSFKLFGRSSINEKAIGPLVQIWAEQAIGFEKIGNVFGKGRLKRTTSGFVILCQTNVLQGSKPSISRAASELDWALNGVIACNAWIFNLSCVSQWKFMEIIDWNGLNLRLCVWVVEEEIYWDVNDGQPEEQDS